MDYSRFNDIGCDDELQPADERRQLESAADAIPGQLREALGKLQIATDCGDEAGAMHANHALAQMIKSLSDAERPKVMAAIQQVVVRTGRAKASAAAATYIEKVRASKEKAPAKSGNVLAEGEAAPVKQAQAAALEEVAGGASPSDAQDQLSRALSELEDMQKQLAALDPRDTARLLEWTRSIGVSQAQIAEAAKAANPRQALRDLAEGVFQAKQAEITKQAMTVESTPAAAEMIMARQREREATAKRVEEAAQARQASVTAKRAEVAARAAGAAGASSDRATAAVAGEQSQQHDPSKAPRELASAPAMAEEPAHELTRVDENGNDAGMLRLTVRLPRVAAVSEIDLEMGAHALALTAAQGLYALTLPLPQRVVSDASKCKWDKKKRVLTVSMPCE